MLPSRQFFISCVSTEFRTYRGELRNHLTTATREVKVQEDFAVGPATLLEKLDDYITNANAVLHLVGKSAGSKPRPPEVRAILDKYTDLASALPELQEDLGSQSCPFTYTQWEAFLAIYHRIPCFIYLADDASIREPGWIEDPGENAAQQAHRARLHSLGRDRATFPFADARDVALSFYRSYEDEAAGATFATSTDRGGIVTWPSVSSPVTYPLADREKELERFLELISGRCPERMLLLYGPSDRGKSTLLAELERIASGCPPLRCGRAEFKNGPTLRDVLWSLSRDLSPGVRFPRFQRELDRNSVEALRTAFLQDLSEASCPVLLILDTYEQATDEARRWVEDSLFWRVVRQDGLRLVVAGQTVPEPDARWARFAMRHELPPITDPVHWLRFREQLGVTCTDESLCTLVTAARGSPRMMGTLLSNLLQKAGS